MRANNLSISVPNKGCNKNCEYCVSKMTGMRPFNEELWKNNFPKVSRIAKSAQVTSVSITGKGEPLLHECLNYIRRICTELFDFPLEIQTNGVILNTWAKSLEDLIEDDKASSKYNRFLINKTSQYSQDLRYFVRPSDIELALDDLLEENRDNYFNIMNPFTWLREIGINTVAVSIDSEENFEELLSNEVFKILKYNDLNTRITVNLSDKIKNGFLYWLDQCKKHAIDQLSFRRITKANFTEKNSIHKWIDKHVPKNMYSEYMEQINEYPNKREIRRLPYGAVLYDINDISVTGFDYCIEDQAEGEDIRSLIYEEDGHLYTAWNSDASRIF
jgi:organic radical activating enzyme